MKSIFEAISALIFDPRNLENLALALAPCTFSRYCLFDMFIDFWSFLSSFWESNRIKIDIKTYLKNDRILEPFLHRFLNDFGYQNGLLMSRGWVSLWSCVWHLLVKPKLPKTSKDARPILDQNSPRRSKDALPNLQISPKSTKTKNFYPQ